MLDPTREDLIAFLLDTVLSQGNTFEDYHFDIEEVAYWIAANYHNGQGSNLYSVLSQSRYTPGPTVFKPENSELYLECEAWIQHS